MASRLPAPASSICLATNNYPDDRHLSAAANRWNNACGDGETIPSFTMGGCSGSPIVIQVV
jgi:hypothetical protein